MQRFQRSIHMRLRSPSATQTAPSYTRKNTQYSTTILGTAPHERLRISPPFCLKGNNKSLDMTVHLWRARTSAVRPTVSRRGASLLFDRRRQIQWKRSHLSWHRRQRTETPRQAWLGGGGEFSPKKMKTPWGFFVALRASRGAYVCVACSLGELFILRVPWLWRSERRQPHSSYSDSLWHHP